MKVILTRAWDEFVSPLLRRPRSHQVAAMCWRRASGAAAREVLLITSRGTGRWVIPKGWPIKRLTGAGAALREAWEEAGVERATADETAFGVYGYDNILEGGLALPCTVEVFAAEVCALADDWPERAQRTRTWVAPEEAAIRVAEPQLQDIFRRFAAG
jgi:8-oxo-dGTP pyrophosphatase MutT (NUDIX family)